MCNIVGFVMDKTADGAQPRKYSPVPFPSLRVRSGNEASTIHTVCMDPSLRRLLPIALALKCLETT